MKKTLLTVVALAACFSTALAIDKNTVEITFNGNTATVTMASNISSYVTNQSSGSHVKLVQSASFAGVDKTVDNEDGEIIYVLSGSTTNGEFYLEGAFKCTVELKGVTITNPNGPAINIQNGKRVSVSAKSGTTNTLTDGANDTYNGAFHCKGHTKFKGKGTLNVKGNSKHAIYSKEYIEIKNLTINVTGAQKDGIHCKEYFLMESGTVKINGTADDGVQVELDGTTSTGVTTGHEDEDTGNFYMTGGTLSISSYGDKAVKADGTIKCTGGTRNFPQADMLENAILLGVDAALAGGTTKAEVFDLQGRRLDVQRSTFNVQRSTFNIVRQGNRTIKVLK